jgi:hypothetical protein
VTNGKRSASSDDSIPPPAKKPKPAKVARTAEEKDAELAARLQAEENGRARSTRGGGVTKRKAPLKKEKPKKRKMKSKTKVGSDDDSIDGSGSDNDKKVDRKGGFHVWTNIDILKDLMLTKDRNQCCFLSRWSTSWAKLNFHDRKLSRKSGNTSRPMGFRIQQTSARYDATMRYETSSNKIKSTCLQ